MPKDPYSQECFLKIIKKVVDDLGYFPSEKEYRIYRSGKKLPMPKVSKNATGLTWREMGIKYFDYSPRTLNTPVEMKCSICSKTFLKLHKEIKKSKNHFCSRSCAATYNNQNKTYGIRRSKLEIWLEEHLIALYPNLEIHFNRKDTIGSELDIYIPSLKLAFELNGIFHYEPIFGNDKLQKIQENDSNKFQKCQEHGISLCIIDTSSQKYFKPKSSQKFLDIITEIIDKTR